MQIVILGTGNAATVFSRLMQSKGHSIVQVWGRNFSKAQSLAKLVKAEPIAELNGVTKNADIYIIAVADKAVEEVASQLKAHDQLVLHTTASLSKHVLKPISRKYGVLYPLQSLRKEMDIDTPIPFLVDGCNEAVTIEIEHFAATLSQTVVRADDEQRVKLHVAAVFACNFSNYMYLQSAGFCEKEGLDFDLLQPLMEETATRLRQFKPSEVFTGPAVRGDVATINKHLSLLEGYPEQHELYKMISEKIMERFGK